MAIIKQHSKTLEVLTPYHPTFVSLLKEKIPPASRSWQKPAWVIDAKYLDEVERLAQLYFDHVEVIREQSASQAKQTILVEYLGRCKGDSSFEVAYANACVNGSWAYRVSEKVLRDYFEGEHSQPEQVTLYGLLGVKPSCSELELKSGYRRACLTWHPDKNPDPDAAEMFRKVKAAYEILVNPLQRQKYEAGLKLMQSQSSGVPHWQKVKRAATSAYGYRAPANCGVVDCTVESGIKNTIVKILDWRDDIKSFGSFKLIRVVRWEHGAKQFTTEWERV